MEKEKKGVHISLYVALGITIGILAGVLVIIVDLFTLTGIPWLAVAVWPGFVAWALYFAHGGGPVSLARTMTCNGVGVIMGTIIILLDILFARLDLGAGLNIGLAIAVIIGAFVLCAEAHWKLLDFIPAAFCGCASSFAFGSAGTPRLIIPLLISLWMGAVLAYLSDLWAQKIVSPKGGDTTPES